MPGASGGSNVLVSSDSSKKSFRIQHGHCEEVWKTPDGTIPMARQGGIRTSPGASFWHSMARDHESLKRHIHSHTENNFPGQMFENHDFPSFNISAYTDSSSYSAPGTRPTMLRTVPYGNALVTFVLHGAGFSTQVRGLLRQ